MAVLSNIFTASLAAGAVTAAAVPTITAMEVAGTASTSTAFSATPTVVGSALAVENKVEKRWDCRLPWYVCDDYGKLIALVPSLLPTESSFLATAPSATTSFTSSTEAAVEKQVEEEVEKEDEKEVEPEVEQEVEKRFTDDCRLPWYVCDDNGRTKRDPNTKRSVTSILSSFPDIATSSSTASSTSPTALSTAAAIEKEDQKEVEKEGEEEVKKRGGDDCRLPWYMFNHCGVPKVP